MPRPTLSPDKKRPKRGFLQRLLSPFFVAMAVAFMALEEWLWDTITRLTQALRRLRLMAAYEAWLIRLPPYACLAVFLLPSIVLLPLKVFALWLLTAGQALAGIAVVIVAKVLGTAFAARSFFVCKPKLLTIPWFAQLYDTVLRWRAYLYGRLAAMPAYQTLRCSIASWRQRLRQLSSQIKQSKLAVWLRRRGRSTTHL